jgi:hypothetical protein
MMTSRNQATTDKAGPRELEEWQPRWLERVEEFSDETGTWNLLNSEETRVRTYYFLAVKITRHI